LFIMYSRGEQLPEKNDKKKQSVTLFSLLFKRRKIRACAVFLLTVFFVSTKLKGNCPS